MPHRNRDTLGKFLPNNPTPSNPSLFFGESQFPSLTIGELEDPLGEQPKIFEELIGEEKDPIPHTHAMAKNKNEDIFPIRETNGDARMKNIIPTSLPHFHGLTYEDPGTFMFESAIVYRTYEYTSYNQK